MFISISPEVEELFNEKIKQYLQQGKTTTTVQKKTSRKVKYVNTDALDGQVNYIPLEKTNEYTENTNITHHGVPDYIMQLVANSLSVEKAIEFLQTKGFIVLDPTIKEDKDSDNQGGISDQTVETIKKKILGID
jgi:hypothetical protein